jgi:acyl-homoserine-lactone acylase
MLQILERTEGIPWVNTIVADKWGHALYADIGSIPGVSDALAKTCDTALGAATFGLLGLPILNGEKSSCDWQTGPGAASPGLFGPNQEPHLFRSDYVTNSNDSYWLANPHHADRLDHGPEPDRRHRWSWQAGFHRGEHGEPRPVEHQLFRRADA